MRVGDSEMTRISKFARPLGIALAVVGFAMIAISGYYLLAYMRSGSDADAFNVQAAPPEDYLELLGQGIPNPSARDGSVVSREQERTVESVVEVEQVRLQDPPLDHTETVSIASVLPGLPLAPRQESAEFSGKVIPHEAESVANRGASPTNLVLADASDELDSKAPPVPVAPSSSLMLETFASIYPGGNMNPRYWSDPHWAGNMPFGGPTIPEGFLPVDPSELDFGVADGEHGVRMRIPAIDLDAVVSELEIRDLGDSRQWGTPDKVVGHIPTTANPGEPAHGWYFGHLDNFISNEGDIFRRLPEIAKMIKNDPVDIFLTTSDAEYMYRVTATQQLHRDDLYLTASTNSQITLVTCWPFRVYDHRILVSALLIAIKPLQEA